MALENLGTLRQHIAKLEEEIAAVVRRADELRAELEALGGSYRGRAERCSFTRHQGKIFLRIGERIFKVKVTGAGFCQIRLASRKEKKALRKVEGWSRGWWLSDNPCGLYTADGTLVAGGSWTKEKIEPEELEKYPLRAQKTKELARLERELESLSSAKAVLQDKLEKQTAILEHGGKCVFCGRKTSRMPVKDKDGRYLLVCKSCAENTLEGVRVVKDKTTVKKAMELIGAEDEKLFKIAAETKEALVFSDYKNYVLTEALLEIKKAYEEFRESGFRPVYTSELAERLKPLGVKKSWIRELEEQGILEPQMRVLLEIKGREVPAKVWDLSELTEEKLKEIKAFVEAKEKERKRKAKEAAKRLQEGARRFREKIREKREKVKEAVQALRDYHPFLETALYLYHLNHYAKTERYENYRDEIYDLKKKALLKAYELWPDLFSIFFVNRGDRICYCENCRDLIYEEWDLFGRGECSFGEYIRSLPQEPCSACRVDKDYYSLIEFQIITPPANFCFHVPYPQVAEVFPKKKFPWKSGRAEEYASFGREIDRRAYEHILFPIRSLLSKVKKFLKAKPEALLGQASVCPERVQTAVLASLRNI